MKLASDGTYKVTTLQGSVKGTLTFRAKDEAEARQKAKKFYLNKAKIISVELMETNIFFRL